MPEDRIQILAELLQVDTTRFSSQAVAVINSLSKHEFDCLLSLRARISDSSALNHYDHAIMFGI